MKSGKKSLTLGSFECSGHSTWSRLQYLLLFGSYLSQKSLLVLGKS